MQAKVQDSQDQGEPRDLLSTSCQICNMGSEEIKCIISHLISSLKGINADEPNENVFDCGGFSKLLKLIFHSKCKNFRDTMNCTHTKAQMLFSDKLDIDLVTLDKISNKKIISLAKYNFHMDVVSLQVKSFPRHFASIQNRKQTRNLRKKLITPQKTDRTGIHSKKLIQQKQKTPPTKYSVVKQQADQSEDSKHKNECMQYHHMAAGTFAYHPIRFQNQFSQLMNNMMMLSYGFHPNQP